MTQTNYLHNDPKAVANIQQLIASGEETSIALALQLVENGGLPINLFTYLFAVYLFYNRADLAYEAQNVLEKQAPDLWEECCLIPIDWVYVADERVGLDEASTSNYLTKTEALEPIETPVLANLVLKYTGWGGAYCLNKQTAPYYEILQEIFEDGELSFEAFRLEELPEEIGQFTQTKELILVGNRLTDLPDSLANLTLLENLDFDADEVSPLVIEKLEKMFPKLMGEYYADLGDEALDDKAYEMALQHTEKALTLDDSQIEYWNQKGNTLAHLKRYEEAYVIFEQCVVMDPKYVIAHASKAQIKFFQKDYNQAMKITLFALSLYEKDPTIPRHEEGDIYTLKGVIHSELGEYQQAHDAYDVALGIYPHNDMALYNKACAYALQKNKNEAFSLLKECLKHDWEKKFLSQAVEDKDFAAYWQDPDFLTITRPDHRNSNTTPF
ncbi:hypothetical protein BKI52_14145 [marine bacterium AO1-C]|nr:hypothetical protein BKI52_14145 [marine bacterium AO1-C]